MTRYKGNELSQNSEHQFRNFINSRTDARKLIWKYM